MLSFRTELAPPVLVLQAQPGDNHDRRRLKVRLADDAYRPLCRVCLFSVRLYH
jgi:hypothetical protein